MKSTIQLSLLLLALVSLNLTAQQNCETSTLETAPASRFTNNNDGTVTDTQTTLIWARCAQGLSGTNCAIGALVELDWSNALLQSGNRPTSVTNVSASDNDWRLPNVKELQSLVERTCTFPSINKDVFPNTPESFLWSSSPHAFFMNSAWGVNFLTGAVSSPRRSAFHSIRLVRGGSAQ